MYKCIACGNDNDILPELRCSHCKHRKKEYNAENYKVCKLNGICPQCGKSTENNGLAICNKCNDKHNQHGSILRSKTKKRVMDHYGGRCVCCGETRMSFLTIDHINNDGWLQRRILFGDGTGGNAFYVWLIKNTFPVDLQLQVLCFNCNLSKHINGGICEHNTTLVVDPIGERLVP